MGSNLLKVYIWYKGGLEGWRDGGMEGWRDGGMEGWRGGDSEAKVTTHRPCMTRVTWGSVGGEGVTWW